MQKLRKTSFKPTASFVLELSTAYCLAHRQLVVSIPRLSPPFCHLLGKMNAMVTSVISIMVSHLDCIDSCLVEKNVPIGLILPSRRQDGAESPVIERINCSLSWVLDSFSFTQNDSEIKNKQQYPSLSPFCSFRFISTFLRSLLLDCFCAAQKWEKPKTLKKPKLAFSSEREVAIFNVPRKQRERF